MTWLGYVITGILWLIALSPIIVGLVRFMRTTKLSDLKLRVRRVERIQHVPNCHGVRMVSTQRALADPGCWEQVTPWAWRHK